MLKRLLLAALCLIPFHALAQYTAPYVGLTGTLSSSNGMPASGYILTLVPSQPMYVGGTSIVVSNANCGTDSNGAIVGTPNPVGPAVLAANPGTGTLPPANYYVVITWYDSYSHQTLASPERMVQLTLAGNIAVSPPVAGAPLSATGMNVYIGTSSGAETYQGHTTNPASTYTQSIPLVAGAALPTFNNTVCITVANDAAWPIGGYQLNFTTQAGNNVPGYPQQVQFIGPGSAFNLSNGLPLWNGRVTFPVPIVTLPYNHNAQSISGPLSFVGYNIYSIGHVGVGTALPAWGVDVEGTGAAAAINANQGYLVNGNGGTVNQGLCSDGTYFDQACTFVTTLPTLYYQTVLDGPHGTDALAQTSYLAAGAGTGLDATNQAAGGGGIVARTQLSVHTPASIGTYPNVVMSAGSETLNRFACWAGPGAIVDSTAPCASSGVNQWVTFTSCVPPTDGDNQVCQGGPISWPVAFADSSYHLDSCMVDDSSTSSASPPPTAFVQTHGQSASGFSYSLTAVKGSSGPYPYSWPVTCHAFHP